MSAAFDYRLAVRGTSTYVRERAGAVSDAGAPDVPTVLLLPGGALDTVDLTWAPVLDGLPTGWRLVLPELPGYGLSTRLRAPTTAAYVRWLDELVDVLGLDRFVLAGSSKGGAVALAYALRRPDRLSGLVLSAPYGVQARVPFHALAWRLARLPRAAALARHVLRRPAALAFFFRVVALGRASSLTPDLLHDAYAGLLPPDALEVFVDWLRHELRPEGCRTNLAPRLADLAVPLLWLHGRRDRTTPFARAEAVAPPGTLVPFNAGHLPPRECPEAALRAVQAFVEAVSGGA